MLDPICKQLSLIKYNIIHSSHLCLTNQVLQQISISKEAQISL